MRTQCFLKFVTVLLLINALAVFIVVSAQDTVFAGIVPTGKPSIDRILVEKQARRLTLLSKGKQIKMYKIALGQNSVGPKEKEGDGKTPEGFYAIDAHNRNSGYHRSLHISYPSELDRKHAKKLGVSPGGSIMIHGMKNGFGWIGPLHIRYDWTNGCIAVTDKEIEEIYSMVPYGTAVEIRP